MSKGSVRVLWVEDSIGDILLIKEAFEQVDFPLRLHVVNDGVEATDFLFRRARYAHALPPELIILDLNLPKKNGREVISAIKTDPELLKIPLIVLTTSNADQNVLAGLDPKHSLYLVKPMTFNALVNMANQIHDFWLSLSHAEGLNPKSAI
jgi:CheY-like chemotaxis protein